MVILFFFFLKHYYCFIYIQAKNNKSENDEVIKDVEIGIPLKYLNSFWRTFEMHLINCGINLILTWSSIQYNLKL